MHLAKVIAKVVSTQKVDSLIGGKLLVIRAVNENMELMPHETPYVAVDRVGAGVGHYVLVDWGGSMDNDVRMVSDMSIVGIIDTIETE
jgi:ethanolamine utilization protein EutN